MSIKTVVVIIPTYNESSVIEETINQVHKATNSSEFCFHILIFDSGSTDDTQHKVSRLQEIYPYLHLITESQKTGLGSAYLQAMRYALDHLKAHIVVEFDADLSHQPCYLLPMMDVLNEHDVVLGSRYVKGGSIPEDWGWHRKFLSQMGNKVARLTLTPQYKDFTSGFRATHHTALMKALPERFISNNYAYKLELLWNLHKTQAKIKEYPIAFVDRTQGISKLPSNSIFDALYVLATLRFKELKSYFSMCTVGLMGLMVQYVIYNSLRLFCAPATAASVAVLAAIINNFILNHKITFKHKQLKLKAKSFAFFAGYSALMITFQSSWMRLGIAYWGNGFLKENLIMFSGIVGASVVNYLFYSRIIWK